MSFLSWFIGFIKVDKWWVYKIAGGLFTVIIFTIWYKIPIHFQFWKNLAVLFSSFGVLAVFGHLLNDLTDLESDRLSGKRNSVSQIGTSTSTLLVVLLAAFGLLLLYTLNNQLLFALGIFQVVFNLAYSVRPVRLKERGFWAVIVTGFYERALPYAMIGTLLQTTAEFDFIDVITIYLVWSFFWEARNFLTGQQTDQISDLQTNQKTVAVVYDGHTLNTIQRLLFLAEIGLFIAWMFQFAYWPVIVIISTANAVYFHHRKFGEYRFSRSQLFNMVDDVYNLSLPVLFAGLALITYSESLWPLFTLLLIAFDNHFRMLFVIVVKNIDWQKWLRHVTFPYRMISLIFNWSVYYFRKWVLKWPEERNWGKHYPEYLEKKQLKASKKTDREENNFEQDNEFN